MRETKTLHRPGVRTTSLKAAALLIMGIIVLLFSGCADESVDGGEDCQTNLDNRQFQAVADNSACSYYHRGSAEMGLGGFLFENFLAEDADSNFAAALGLTAGGCSASGSESLVGSYNSTPQRRFLRAQYWSRTKPQADGITRGNDTIEISYFSTLAEIIAETYCRLDANLDGTISATENKSFTQINIGSSSVGSSNLNASTGLYQIVASGVPWLCDSAGSGICRRDLTYEGVWDNADSGTTNTYAVLAAAASNISAFNIIVKVESLQQLFDPTATSTEINAPYEFLSMYTNRAGLLLTDLTALGVSESDDLYENVKESVGKMDNGGTCTNSSVQVLDLLTKIVQNAAPQTTAASLPSTSYRNYNLLSTTDIPLIDTGESTLTAPFTLPSNVTLQARLIFKNGATYTGLYKTADAGIKNTLSNLATLTLDSSNTLIPVTAGDERIQLKELLCLED